MTLRSPSQPRASGHASPTDAVSVRFCEDRRLFVELPRRLYGRDDPGYVPPLSLVERRAIDRKKHPFFSHARAEFFVAERDGEPVGRISAVRDHMHDAFHQDRVGMFGHFEAADEETAHALLRAAEDWLVEHDATEIRGPIDLSTNYRCGLLIEGPPGPPAFGIPYNPPSYPDWLASYGLDKAKDLWTVRMATEKFDDRRMRRIVGRVAERHNVAVRARRVQSWPAEVDLLWQLYNEIWERNWGFVPMSKPEFDYEARGMRQILRPEMVRFVEHAGRAVGFVIGLPDLNEGIRACNGRLLPFGWWKLKRAVARTNRCRVLAFGVIREFRNRGLELLLLQSFVDAGRACGITEAECGWILEDNDAMLQPVQRLGGEKLRRYRIYGKPVPGGGAKPR